jgi:hypothetical protein
LEHARKTLVVDGTGTGNMVMPFVIGGRTGGKTDAKPETKKKTSN